MAIQRWTNNTQPHTNILFHGLRQEDTTIVFCLLYLSRSMVQKTTKHAIPKHKRQWKFVQTNSPLFALLSGVNNEHVSSQLVLGPGVGLRLVHHSVHHGGDHTDAGHLMGCGAVSFMGVVGVVRYMKNRLWKAKFFVYIFNGRWRKMTSTCSDGEWQTNSHSR